MSGDDQYAVTAADNPIANRLCRNRPHVDRVKINATKSTFARAQAFTRPRVVAALAVALIVACCTSNPLLADDVLHLFLQRHCVRCHGAEEQNAERRFDNLDVAITDNDVLIDYQDILDQLNLGQMPPEDEPQPGATESSRVIALLTSLIAEYHESNKQSEEQPVLRRMNSREYRNTIRDLLKLDVTIYDPTEPFPRDQTSEHLDNIGSTLVTSGYLLARYLEAAEIAVDKAILSLEKPEEKTWAFRDHFDQQPEIDQVHRYLNRFKHMTLFDVPGADKPEGAYGPIHAFADGVPHDGTYELKFKAEALNRIHPYDRELVGTDPDEPLRLGIVPGNQEVGLLHLPQPVQPLLAEIDLADGSKWYTVRVHLDAGFTPRFTFQNGLMDARNLWTKLVRKHPDMFAKGLKGIVQVRRAAISAEKLPQIRIHEVEIRGPLYQQWPTESQQVIFGDAWDDIQASGAISESQTRDRLTAFMRRAYRQPVSDDEVERVMAVVQDRRAAGRDSIQAFSDGLKAVLCSPKFIYLPPADHPEVRQYALASRLSYFLWSSMPDDELIDLASNGSLDDVNVLRQQVDRMLRDDKSDAFINGFLDSWLDLRSLGAMPPDRGDFVEFYRHDLGEAMRTETRLFTRHLAQENLSILNFLDSDFTFVNRPLAELYELDERPVAGFQRVTLSDRRRGGLLGQGSVLTVTANGIDTSPVVRGVWLLDNLLGTPPSPPPPDVEPLDPDTRGATSIRDQLDKHREIESCNECHRKIDPLGFALENFDPIGRWRTRYGRNVDIDATGQLAGGQRFDGVAEFKSLLLLQQDQFAKAFAEKLLAYAVGRHIDAADRPDVDAILDATKPSDYALGDLITQVVCSDLFRCR
mgnify:CR=1 FL=1